MSETIAELIVMIKADDHDVNAKLQTLENQLQRTGNAAGNGGLGGGMAGLARGLGSVRDQIAPFVSEFERVVGVAAEFQDVMTEIEVRGGATADELQRIKTEAVDLGEKFGMSASESAQAVLELVQSGQSVEDALRTLPDVLNLAAAGNLDLKDAADGVTDVLAQMQLGVEDTTHVVDALSAAADVSSADVDDLIDSFRKGGGVAAEFGLSIEDTAAVFAIFAENGRKGNEAGTLLKSMLMNMTRDVPAAKDAWNELGTSFYDLEGNARPLNDVLRDIKVGLADKTEEEKNQLLTDLAGSYGIAGLAALTSSEDINTWKTKLDEAASASEIAEAKQGTFNATLDRFGASISNLATSVITPFMEGVLTPFIDFLQVGVQNLKGLLDVIGAVAGRIEREISKAQGALAPAPSLTPTEAGQAALSQNPDFTKSVQQGTAFKLEPSAQLANILNSGLPANDILSKLQDAGLRPSEKLISLWELGIMSDPQFDAMIKAGFHESDTLAAIVAKGLPPEVTWEQILGNGVPPSIDLKNYMATGVGAAETLMQLVAAGVPPDQAFAALMAAGVPPSEELKRVLSNITVTVKVDGGNAAPPGRAAGGPVAAGGMYLVGERGPELFSPRRSGQIVPNHALAGGGTNIIINGPISFEGIQDMAAAFEQLQREKRRRNVAAV